VRQLKKVLLNEVETLADEKEREQTRHRTHDALWPKAQMFI
jgi:hypothetical protein